VPFDNPSRPVVDGRELSTLAQSFEIGAHGATHRSLTRLTVHEAWNEIREGKDRHEQTLGAPVVSFCYPKGRVNGVVKRLVREAGFAGARTCRLNRIDVPRDPFLWGVTTQAYAHRPFIQIRHAVREGNFRGAWNYATVHRAAVDWADHFLHGMEFVERHGGIAHLYLHSWEIEENRDWRKLERVLSNAAGRDGFRYVSNGELFLAHERLRRGADATAIDLPSSS